MHTQQSGIHKTLPVLGVTESQWELMSLGKLVFPFFFLSKGIDFPHYLHFSSFQFTPLYIKKSRDPFSPAYWFLFMQPSWDSLNTATSKSFKAGSWWPATWNYSSGFHWITECSIWTKWQCHGTEGKLRDSVLNKKLTLFILILLINNLNASPISQWS